MARVIALMALAALGLTEAPVHEPVHDHHSERLMSTTERYHAPREIRLDGRAVLVRQAGDRTDGRHLVQRSERRGTAWPAIRTASGEYQAVTMSRLRLAARAVIIGRTHQGLAVFPGSAAACRPAFRQLPGSGAASSRRSLLWPKYQPVP